jgi:peptide-methionine (S)-S-oxide reductase
MTLLNNVKPVALALFIGLALVVTGCPPLAPGSGALNAATDRFCDSGPGENFSVFAADSRQVALAQSAATPTVQKAAFFPATAFHRHSHAASKIILTQSGPRQRSLAFGFYRESCGRDLRIHLVSGGAAPFASG